MPLAVLQVRGTFRADPSTAVSFASGPSHDLAVKIPSKISDVGGQVGGQFGGERPGV